MGFSKCLESNLFILCSGIPQEYPIFLADIDQVSELIDMRLVGIPLIALFNPKGEPVARWPGEIEVDEIENFIENFEEDNDPLSSGFN